VHPASSHRRLSAITSWRHRDPSRPAPSPAPRHFIEGGDRMKKLSVRKLETVKTTAALYGASCVL
jgi:hypothetical protein